MSPAPVHAKLVLMAARLLSVGTLFHVGLAQGGSIPRWSVQVTLGFAFMGTVSAVMVRRRYVGAGSPVRDVLWFLFAAVVVFGFLVAG